MRMGNLIGSTAQLMQQQQMQPRGDNLIFLCSARESLCFETTFQSPAAAASAKEGQQTLFAEVSFCCCCCGAEHRFGWVHLHDSGGGVAAIQGR